jgi:N-acetylglucosamine malate deacetylase 1
LSGARQEFCKKRYEQWLDYVNETVRLLAAGASIPIGPTEPPCESPAPSRPRGTPMKILVAAPHPDDEALIGALPVRLRLETGAQVVNCAVTLGSKISERRRRASELRCACRTLGFSLIIPEEEGFSNVNLQNREKHPEEWAAKVQTLKEIFDRERPEIVLAPHAEDFNTTHIGTHYLVIDALGKHLEASGREPLPLILTEFWHELRAPNFMVEAGPEVVALQVMATAEHGGEVSRNPYHLRLPARMMDNVRRGAEVVGGQGAPAPRLVFAELYRVSFMKGPEHVMPRPGGCMLGLGQKFDIEWLRSTFWPEGA